MTTLQKRMCRRRKVYTYHLLFCFPTFGSTWREFRRLDDHRDNENQVSHCKERCRTELVGPAEFVEVETVICVGASLI